MENTEDKRGTRWEFIKSPNYWPGRKMPCTVLVYHYTAGGSADGCVKYFQQPETVSAHFVVGRDGKIIQMVNLSDRSWHAGDSIWKGKKWVNNFSVGIEICNWGPLKKKGDKFYCWPSNYGIKYTGGVPFQDSLGNYWENYTEKQIGAVIEVSKFILDNLLEITLDNVTGHEFISPGRKQDPGPAFPWEKIRSELSNWVEAKSKPKVKTDQETEDKKDKEKNIIEIVKDNDLKDDEFIKQIKERSGDRKGKKGSLSLLLDFILSLVKKLPSTARSAGRGESRKT